MRAIFRVDAGPEIGHGHAMRCLALAELCEEAEIVTRHMPSVLVDRLEAIGAKITWIGAAAGSKEDALLTAVYADEKWLVIDGHHFDSTYQLVTKQFCKTLVIDDHGHLPVYPADFILNHHISADKEMYRGVDNARLLLGPEYALIRKEFRLPWYRRKHKEQAGNVLITLGGGEQSEALDRITGVLARNTTLHLSVVDGLDSNLPHLMTWADIAVSAGGTTSYELAFMGVPALSLIVADNQTLAVEALALAGVVINLGEINAVSDEELLIQVLYLMNSRRERELMADKGRFLVDGLGASRVISVMEHEDTISS